MSNGKEQEQPQQPSVELQPARSDKRVLVDLLQIVASSEMRQQYARELIAAEVARDLFDQDWRLAKIFALSGQFADIKGTTEQSAISTAMAKIQLGRSWGLSPGDALQFVYFTNGKPAVQNEIIASKLREAGYDWDIQWHEVAQNGRSVKACIGCTLWPKLGGEQIVDRDGQPISVSFTKDDADRALIWEKGQQIPLSQKWNFVSWPRDMYFWKAIARFKRYHATNVLAGARTPDEAEESEPEIPKTGSIEAAERVAADKVAKLTARRDAGRAETPYEHDERLRLQSEQQLANAKAKEEAKPAPTQQDESKMTPEELDRRNREMDAEIMRKEREQAPPAQGARRKLF